MSSNPQIKNYYESYWADDKKAYSGAKQGYAPNFRRWMTDQLKGIRCDSPILEVGCGDASFTADLAKISSDVTAIDISATQIEENRQHYPSIKFQQHDVAEPFPFENGVFDVIWCSEVLEHLFDPIFAVREMYRVMAPGGRLLITVPYHGRLKNVLIALFKFDRHYTPSNPHVRFFTKRTLGRMVAEAGFSSIQINSCGMSRPMRNLIVPTNILLRASKGAGR